MRPWARARSSRRTELLIRMKTLVKPEAVPKRLSVMATSRAAIDASPSGIEAMAGNVKYRTAQTMQLILRSEV